MRALFTFRSKKIQLERLFGRVTRVARWYIFKPKIQSRVNLGWSCNGRYWYFFIEIWYILQLFGIVNGHLVYFVLIWYIFPVLVRCNKKNLATLGDFSPFGWLFTLGIFKYYRSSSNFWPLFFQSTYIQVMY
jgi:hypothetical protein